MTSLITRTHDMDTLFGQLWGSSCRPVTGQSYGQPYGQSYGHSTGDSSSTLRPRADIEETDDAYRVRMDLPGIKREDLKIEVENDTLLIEAERKTEAKDDVQVLHRERKRDARFVRRFSLGDSVQTGSIKASLNDGVLELTLPKAEQALPRRINVE
ncbi:Hsp20/alpha crystallin family protein [bacterium]|nr:MAG: Hsp20/alpha crystallin family protein [bacterium]